MDVLGSPEGCICTDGLSRKRRRGSFEVLYHFFFLSFFLLVWRTIHFDPWYKVLQTCTSSIRPPSSFPTFVPSIFNCHRQECFAVVFIIRTYTHCGVLRFKRGNRPCHTRFCSHSTNHRHQGGQGLNNVSLSPSPGAVYSVRMSSLKL